MRHARRFAGLVVMATFLAGCATATTAPSSSPGLDRIRAKGELVVGTAASMPPLNMTTKTGEIIGLEMDLARAMAAAMKVKLRLAAMPFANLLPALEAGQVDMILSGMTMTPERNMRFAFVGPYFVSGKSFLAKEATLARQGFGGSQPPQHAAGRPPRLDQSDIRRAEYTEGYPRVDPGLRRSDQPGSQR